MQKIMEGSFLKRECAEFQTFPWIMRKMTISSPFEKFGFLQQRNDNDLVRITMVGISKLVRHF